MKKKKKKKTNSSGKRKLIQVGAPGRTMALERGPHPNLPNLRNQYICYLTYKRDFAHVIKIRILGWRHFFLNYLGGPNVITKTSIRKRRKWKKWKRRYNKRVRSHSDMAMNQAGSRSWENEGVSPHLEFSEGIHLWTLILPHKIHFKFLLSRVVR